MIEDHLTDNDRKAVISKAEYRKLQKAVARACRAVERCLKEEPTTIIISGGDETGVPEDVVAKITAWLFRRSEDGHNNS